MHSILLTFYAFESCFRMLAVVLILDFVVVDFFYGCLGFAHLLITVKICVLIKRQNVVNIKHFSNNLTEF